VQFHRSLPHLPHFNGGQAWKAGTALPHPLSSHHFQVGVLLLSVFSRAIRPRMVRDGVSLVPDDFTKTLHQNNSPLCLHSTVYFVYTFELDSWALTSTTRVASLTPAALEKKQRAQWCLAAVVRAMPS
jgi:hypothetical protein